MMTAPPDDPPAPARRTPAVRRRPGRVRLAGWAAVALALGAALSQCVVLVRRVARGKTDFSVIYRTAQAINRGEDGDLYAGARNAKWPRSIPPVGTAPFQALALMRPAAAAAVWCVAAMVVLAGGAACLVLTVAALAPDRGDYRDALPWALAVMGLLACDCLQTGQFSILFAACWLAFMLAASRGRSVWAGLALALPAAIKFYPAVLAAVPLALRRGRALLWFALGWLALTALVPLCVLGPARAWDLSRGYVRHNFLADENVVNLRFHAATISNQGIDVVMLRYLTHDREFHAAAAHVPHLDLPRRLVLALAQVVRAGVLALAAVASWRWCRAPGGRGRALDAIVLTALWAAALYLILPETKARYAVYVAPAYLPVLAAAAAAGARRDYRALAGWVVLVCASLAAVIYLPKALLQFGLGLAGPVMIFAAVLVVMGGRVARASRP